MKHSIGILGNGHIGGTLSRLLQQAGYVVATSSTKKANRSVIARSEVVVLAVPWTRIPDLADAGDAFNGKIVIDATNPFSISYEPIRADAPFASGGAQNSARFPGAKLVKSFNTLLADDLASRSTAVERARVALALCGDDASAKLVVAELINDVGFAPVDIGGLDAAVHQEPGGTYFTRILSADEVRNGEIARRFVERVLAQGDMAVFNELVADDIVVTSGIRPFAPMVGKSAFLSGLGALAAFSDGEMHVEDILPAGDRVTVRYKASALHTGPQLGVPATGKRITMWEMRLMRIAAGRIVEDFVADINYDWPWLVAPQYHDEWLKGLA